MHAPNQAQQGCASRCMWLTDGTPAPQPAGALIGALICVTPPDEIDKLFSSTSAGLLKSRHTFAREGEELTPTEKLGQFLQNRPLADVEVLKECVRTNLGDVTFQEQYNRTGRILNITVNSRRRHGCPRLLNYLTSPNVVIWSAACASCAFTGLFEEVEVLCKGADGELVGWNPAGTKWSDGSMQTDLCVLTTTTHWDPVFLLSQEHHTHTTSLCFV